MAITHIDSAENGAANGTAMTITHGFTILDGDVIVAYCSNNGLTSGVVDNNPGFEFTERYGTDYAGGSPSAHLILQERVCGPSEPAVYNWTASDNNRWGIILMQFRGVDDMDPWDILPSVAAENTGGGVTAITPDADTSVPDCEGIGLWVTDSASRNFSAFTNGYVDEIANLNMSASMLRKPMPSSGLQGTAQATQSASEQWLAYQMALKPKGSDPVPNWDIQPNPPNGQDGVAYFYDLEPLLSTNQNVVITSTGAGALPDGIAIVGLTLTGTPIVVALFGNLQLTATNGGGADQSDVFDIDIVPVGDVAPINDVPMPDQVCQIGEVFAGFDVAPFWSGSPAPTFTAAKLPTGLTIDAAGNITGTPTGGFDP